MNTLVTIQEPVEEKMEMKIQDVIEDVDNLDTAVDLFRELVDEQILLST